jgi:hypothetical protein
MHRDRRLVSSLHSAVHLLAQDIACPVPGMPEHEGASGSGDLFVVPTVGYASLIRCRTCGFEFRVTDAQARRYVKCAQVVR